METSAYRLLITEIYAKETREKTPHERLVEKLCKSFEALQKFLASQDPAELPVALQLGITASSAFKSEKPFCDLVDFDCYGGWTSFHVQSQVLKLFTCHDCQGCRSGSLKGCLFCLTWVTFTGYDLVVDSQNIVMSSSRFNGFQNAVEGSARPGKVELKFQSNSEALLGCSVKT
jgi:hypothetical protein